MPDPKTFMTDYVQEKKPLLLKGAAKPMAAYTKWDSDDYLMKHYGHLEVTIEHGKKETRESDLDTISMAEFLQTYNESDVFLVDDTPQELMEELEVLPILSAGGFTEKLSMTLLWLSSGNTRSVIHYDDVENINCLFTGQKEFVLMDEKYQPLIESDEGGWIEKGTKSWRYAGKVDVDNVDLEEFPAYKEIEHYSCTMEAGDCLYLPQYMYHQVRSHGRNLAINLWWKRLEQFDEHAPVVTDLKLSNFFEPADQEEAEDEENEGASHETCTLQ